MKRMKRIKRMKQMKRTFFFKYFPNICFTLSNINTLYILNLGYCYAKNKKNSEIQKTRFISEGYWRIFRGNILLLTGHIK